jgi:hypothetical protein
MRATSSFGAKIPITPHSSFGESSRIIVYSSLSFLLPGQTY